MPKSTPERIIDRAYGDAGRATAYATAPAGGSSSGGADAFLDLSDTPNSFAGQGGRFLAVASGEASVLFRAVVDGDIPNTLVRTARTLTGGDGIDTIGDLSTDRTVNVDATVARTSTEIVAGAGLTGGGTIAASRTINVGAGAGITVNANDVALTTPGSLSATSTNSSSGSHTHAIDATIARSAIQINSGSGLTGGGDLTANRTLNVGAGTGITVNSDDVAVNQGYGFAWTANHSWANAAMLGSAAFDSSFPIQGWRINEVISGLSALTIGKIAADELSVKVFVADETRVDRGNQYWTKSYGIVAEGFTTPSAIGGTVNVTFEDSPALVGAIFSNNDWLLFRLVDVSSGLAVSSIWGQVSGYTNLGSGRQRWTFTLRSGPTSTLVKAGVTATDFGASGSPLIHLSVIDNAGAPYIKMRSWAGANPYTPGNFTTHVQVGELSSLSFPSQPANEYGFYAGNGRQVADQYVRISTWGSELHNLPLRLYAGGVATVAIDPAYPSIAVGDDATEITYDADTNAGFFVGKRPSTGEYTFRLGDEEQYIKWDGAKLTISGVIRVKDGSDVKGLKYRVEDVTLWNPPIVNPEESGGGLVRFLPGLIGIMTNGLGEQFALSNIPVMYDGESITITSGYEDVLMFVLKNGTGITNPDGGVDHPHYYGIDNPASILSTLFIEVFYERADSYYNNSIYSSAQRSNHVIIGRVRLNSSYSQVIAVFGAGETGTTVIGPGYIKTDTLAAISADLGEITAGSIEVGSTNKLWLNKGSDGIVLALGPAATGRANAPFRVWNTGKFRAGDETRYIQYDSSTGLEVKGTINADAGYLGSLSVSGTVSVGNDGKIAWANGDGFLDRLGIYYAEKVGSSLAAVLRVGRPAPFAQGMIDVDMFAQADSQWDYAFHVTDGGNSNNSYSALYHGQSAVPGTAAVDRIFNAYTTNAGGGSPVSDGYYSDLAAGQWLDFDSSGVSFKGISRGGQPVAVFQQVGGGAAGPVVFAGSDQNNRAMYVARGATGATFQAGFKAEPSGAINFIALDAGDSLIGYTKAVMIKDTSDANVPTPPSGYYMLYVNSNSLKIKRADGRVQFYSQAGEYLP